jgi:hypothetical protein
MSLHFPHPITFLNMPILNHFLLGDNFIAVAFPSGVCHLRHVLASPKQILIHVEYSEVRVTIEPLVPDGWPEKSD